MRPQRAPQDAHPNPANVPLIVHYTRQIMTLAPFETLTMHEDAAHREIRIRVRLDPHEIAATLLQFDLTGMTVTAMRFDGKDDHLLIVIAPADVLPLVSKWAKQDSRRPVPPSQTSDPNSKIPATIPDLPWAEVVDSFTRTQ